MNRWELSWFGATFTTTVLNEALLRLGRIGGCFLRVWFDIGVVVGLALSLAATAFVLFSLTTTATKLFSSVVIRDDAQNAEVSGDHAHSESTAVPEPSATFEVVPLLPGVTIPLNEIPYIWVAAVVALIVHEAGHALAAACQNVRVANVGLHFHFLPPIPAAFVGIAPQDEHSVLFRGRLRIYYAGIWHNVVLCGAIFALWTFSGIFLSSVVMTHPPSEQGLMVVALDAHSAIGSAIHVGDSVISINSVILNNAGDVTDHVQSIFTNSSLQPGFCVPRGSLPDRFTKPQIDGVAPCCRADSPDSSRQCFHTKEPGLTPQIPRGSSYPSAIGEDSSTGGVDGAGSDFWCASFKDLQGLRLAMCKFPLLDTHFIGNGDASTCPDDHACVFPVLRRGEIMVRLGFQPLGENKVGEATGFPSTASVESFPVHSAIPQQFTLYIGPPGGLRSLYLAEGSPRAWIQAVASKLPDTFVRWLLVDLAHVVGPRLALHTISLSAGVAFLNALPIWAFDGAHVLSVVLVAAQSVIFHKKAKVKRILPGGSIHDHQVAQSQCLSRSKRFILNTGTAIFLVNTIVTVAWALLSR